jgi:hypothetical protein
MKDTLTRLAFDCEKTRSWYNGWHVAQVLHVQPRLLQSACSLTGTLTVISNGTAIGSVVVSYLEGEGHKVVLSPFLTVLGLLGVDIKRPSNQMLAAA